jgi:hypothetical protein
MTRDIRVDRIGLVQELGKLWTDPMKKKVKEDMAAGGLKLVGGDLCEGKLSSSSKSTINPGKFFKWFNDGKISRKDFVACLRVSSSDAAAFLSEREIEQISDAGTESSSLTIVRKKEIDLTLAQVIAEIAAVAGGELIAR